MTNIKENEDLIKIKFCDMYRNFDENNNIFTDVIKRKFKGYQITDEPDFLIYSCFGTDHHRYMNRNCVKIFYTGEAITPNFCECDYAIAFDRLTFGDRYIRRPVWLYNTKGPVSCDLTDERALNRKFCNFIYSNAKDGANAKLRIEFARKLMEYKQVDCPGNVLNNMSSEALNPREGDWQSGKLAFLKDYKFTIAFENCCFDGYVTEKLLDPFVAHSVPIYMGDPRITEDFNSEAFICANRYEDRLDELIRKVIELDNDDEAYLKMLHTDPRGKAYDPHEMDKLEGFLTDIFRKGNVPYEKDPRGFVRRMSFDGLGRKDKIKYLLFRK
ncbi:MAG: hypothetical protein K6G69_02560 [Lachnospiraceae bacterium]|nr:hypothetical protein [Lachnospiraceae bacterium]